MADKAEDGAVAEEVGMMLQNLLAFMAWFLPHKELIRRTAEDAEAKRDRAGAVAVLMPRQYARVEAEWDRNARRARLLYELLYCLEDTEYEVAEAKRKEKIMIDLAARFGG